ncbi:carbohydrate esterase family 5 protein [Trichoderma virens Gv29-8]|uniref:Cutinase n=1 Tax=Hypocrea virens (strain Gv29-8 / FGSC 10586) TaxID=413071 RepID=G9MGS4_HYPVG|nr:carbohydrate esterase family 5 protein [Trichoderma virens Gv29-8]EHK25919.1 carbohydrate esterase family 5 protein [Trichoderma virens Gv29-8]
MRSLAILATLLAGHAFAYPKPVLESPARRDWPTINEFLTELAEIMPIGDTVSAACDLIGDAEDVAADLFGISNTENDACGDVTVLFARGTCDPGNVGVLVGPFFFRSLQTALGSKTVGVKGVPYPASVQGFLSGSVQPGIDMANQIKSVLSSCPNTKLVLGGYSQGSMVVHNAATHLDAATMSKISAVVLFGDPYDGRPVANYDASKVLVVCHDGDNICQGGDFILLPHLTYAEDADTAAAFVKPLVS